MSELAFTVTGDAFEVPATVTAWRVRRLKARGAPELVYARDGRPLTLSIEADLDDLREAVSTSGKYRLDPINDDGKCVEDVPAAYLQITKGERNGDGAGERGIDTRVDNNAGLAQAVIEAVRLNAEALRHNAEISMRAVDRLPQLMEAMTTMLNVAAGTQLYALQQREVTPPLRNGMEDDYEDDDNETETDDETAAKLPGGLSIPGFDLNKAAGHMAAECMTKMMDRIGAMFGGAKTSPDASVAVPHPSQHQPAATVHGATSSHAPAPMRRRQPHSAPSVVGVVAPIAAPTSTTASSVPAPSADAGVPSDPDSMMHFMAVRNALSPAERTEVLAITQQLTDDERATWFRHMRTLTIPDAVAAVREALEQVAAARHDPPHHAEPSTATPSPESNPS